jgi:hypothetical protein
MLEHIELTTASLGELTYQYNVMHINPAELDILNRLFYQDASCQACFSAIVNFLVNGGVRITKKGFVCTPMMQHMFNTTWIVFAKMILQSVWCYGFVVVDEDDRHHPYVVDPRVMDVAFISGPDGYKRVRLQESRYSIMGHHDKALTTPRVYIEDYSIFTGRINSKVNCMRNLQSFQDMLIACCIRAEQRKAVPPLVQEDPVFTAIDREHARDAGAATYQGTLAFGSRGDGGADAKINDDASNDAPNDEIMNAIEKYGSAETRKLIEKQVREQIREFTRLDDLNESMTNPRFHEGEPYYGKRVNVARGKRLVAAQNPESPDILIELMKMVEADVAKIFAVPPGLWGSQRSTLERSQTMMVVFRSTTQTEKTRFTIVFRDMLNRIFGELNRQHMLDNLDSNKSLQQNMEDSEFQVSFPGMQDPESINWLQETGSMDWETLNVYKAATFDIPLTDFAPRQLEIATGRFLGDIIEEERKLEKQQMQTELAVNTAEGDARVKQTIANTAKTARELPPWIATKVLDTKGNIKVPNSLKQTVDGRTADAFSKDKRKQSGFGNTQAEKATKTRQKNSARITNRASKRKKRS